MNKKELDELQKAFEKVDKALIELDKISTHITRVTREHASEIRQLLAYHFDLEKKLLQNYNGIRHVVYGVIGKQK